MKENTFDFSDEDKARIMNSINPMKAAVNYLFTLKEYYDWVGIYVRSGDELILGPFKGPPTPHTVIPIEKGICGAAVREERTINLGDVWGDDRFIACSTTTRSELVVPIWLDDEVIAEIDIDSNMPRAFSKGDETLVEAVAQLIAPKITL